MKFYWRNPRFRLTTAGTVPPCCVLPTTVARNEQALEIPPHLRKYKTVWLIHRYGASAQTSFGIANAARDSTDNARWRKAKPQSPFANHTFYHCDRPRVEVLRDTSTVGVPDRRARTNISATKAQNCRTKNPIPLNVNPFIAGGCSWGGNASYKKCRAL